MNQSDVKNLETGSFEFSQETEREFRAMQIERIESLMAYCSLNRNQLAKLSGVSKTALYNKLDKDGNASFSQLDIFRLAKAMDLSMVYLLPLSEQERDLVKGSPVPASSIRFVDDMLSARADDIEFLHGVHKAFRQYLAGRK
ncbi:XRE family transcriptional regulator [Alginatibacterium sediminis]|uniref:XRE family transcriptional regulator n=1 Tax=Alginatibacterium sediminis TaxID=2164068 RepID=A0A420E917_9ALTE|nr:XRE family transcriptional regulator [Alginatibacterium sediminis]RKF15784.1 XRE family transcriptional regulator [Alginatibacterium sediminis]